jgi:hypothetical protein
LLVGHVFVGVDGWLATEGAASLLVESWRLGLVRRMSGSLFDL